MQATQSTPHKTDTHMCKLHTFNRHRKMTLVCIRHSLHTHTHKDTWKGPDLPLGGQQHAQRLNALQICRVAGDEHVVEVPPEPGRLHVLDPILERLQRQVCTWGGKCVLCKRCGLAQPWPAEHNM